MPITFGISFTNTPMNHARALVHIYHDGSVGVSTGAVEMGQSVNTKMLQVAYLTLGISPSKIKLEFTNTTMNPPRQLELKRHITSSHHLKCLNHTSTP